VQEAVHALERRVARATRRDSVRLQVERIAPSSRLALRTSFASRSAICAGGTA
jgi:hypothetical protein